MYMIRHFVCYEIIPLNPRFCDVLLANVLSKMKKYSYLFTWTEIPFQAFYQERNLQALVLSPTDDSITLDFFSLLKLCPESRVCEIATMLIYNRSINSLLTVLLLSRCAGKSHWKKKTNLPFIKFFFFAKRLSWRFFRQILPFISNNWYMKRNKIIEISNEKFSLKSRQGKYVKNTTSRG